MMFRISSLPCRSLLAGDSAQDPSAGGPHRLQAGSYIRTRRYTCPGFTLLELLVVIGLIAVLSFLLAAGLSGGGRSASLQAAQATMANLVRVARIQAMASGQSTRLLVQVDVASAQQPSRYLRYVAVQLQTAAGWQTITDTFLPESIYIVPGNFGALPAGLFVTETPGPWTKTDGSPLRSTAFRANQITSEMINSPVAEQWVSFTLSATAGTAQPGDIIVTTGRIRTPGSYAAGESPVELENPEAVRGLALSTYGVPALVNARAGF
jgi:prepilin-type N-terminal cleavage/methylation domain-containing protein